MSALKNFIDGGGGEGGVSDKNTLHPSPGTHKHHKRPSVKRVVRKLSKKAGIHMGRSSPTKTRSASTSAIKLLEHKSEVKGASLVEGEVGWSPSNVVVPSN